MGKLAERAGGKIDAKIHAAENTIKATLSNVERVALLNEILCGYWFADFVVVGEAYACTQNCEGVTGSYG